ncbi:MAG: hypothetical protein IPL32_18615 [Chloracidobacterium sp.]|nr:hypothetical protein [Chloracidobacterium sp.]
MAIYATSQSAAYGKKFGPGVARQRIELVAIVAVTTAMLDNANDEVGLFWVPKGFVPTAITFNATDMDSGTTLAWDVGDDDDENRLMAAITTGQAAGTSVAIDTAGFLYKYTATTLIKAYIQTAATTPVAGTIKVLLSGFVDEEFSTTALVAA